MFDYLMISGLQSLSVWILLLLPNFLSDRGWSLLGIGWAMGTFFLFHLVFQILAGPLADRIGSIKTASLGVIAGSIGGALYGAALWFPWLIFAARISHAIGVALIYAGPLIQLTQTVPLHLRGRIIGYYGLPGFVMIGAGPAISEWLVHNWGFRGVFLSVPLLFALLGWFVGRLPKHLPPMRNRAQPFAHSFKATFAPLKPILIFSTVFGLCFSAWNSFLAPAVLAIGRGGASSFGLGYAAGAIITRLGLSKHVDTGPRRKLAISALFFYGACIGLIPKCESLGQLLALGFLAGMGHGIFYPSLSSIAAERFHPLHGGQAMSLYISSSSFGMFVGPPVWGAIADWSGYSSMFSAAGLSLIIGTTLFLLSLARNQDMIKPEQERTRGTLPAGSDS